MKYMDENHLPNEEKSINERMEVISIDIKIPAKDLIQLHEGETKNILCDISNRNEIIKLIQKINPRTIFHVASVIDLRLFPSPQMEAVNVNGTKNLLEAVTSLSQDEVRYFIYTSSIDVVATHNGIKDANENTPTILTNPSNGYKRTKSFAESIVLQSTTQNLRCCALRPGHIYGPGDSIYSNASEAPVAYGPSSALMSFTYVENTAYYHVLAAKHLVKERMIDLSIISSSHSLTPKSTPRYFDSPYLTHSPLFIYDFNVNFCEMYSLLAINPPSSSTRIPTFVISFLIKVVECLEYISFSIGFPHLFQSHPYLSITSSILEACVFLSIQSNRADRLLTSEKTNLPSEMRIFTKDEAITRTKSWAKTGQLS